MNPSEDFPARRRIGILVFPDFEPLDVWGFIEAFAIARFVGTGYATTGPRPFETLLVSTERRATNDAAQPAPVRSMNGPRVAPDLFLDQAADAGFEVLMVPGGQGVASLLAGDARALEGLLDWLRAMDGKVPIMASVCTGAALLARAGLLDGRPAATNHQAFGWVAGFGPRVQWDNVARWVDAGHYVTSAGVSAGTDMAWHLLDRLAGRAVAEAAATAAEYGWHRDPQAPIRYPQQAVVPASS